MDNSAQASKCPLCGADVPAGAVKCAHCGELLDERGDKGFLDWYFWDIYFRHYADICGRLSRKRYWVGLAFCLVISGLLGLLDFWIIMVTLLPVPIASLLFGLVMLVPGLAATVRRLRDAGVSPWWLLVVLIPNYIVYFISFIPSPIFSILYLILLSLPSKKVMPEPVNKPSEPEQSQCDHDNGANQRQVSPSAPSEDDPPQPGQCRDSGLRR